MFPERQSRRPMSPYPLFPPHRPMPSQQNITKANVMALLQDADGNFDLEKITTTAQQINQIYSQVSPMISRFMNR